MEPPPPPTQAELAKLQKDKAAAEQQRDKQVPARRPSEEPHRTKDLCSCQLCAVKCC